MKTAKVFMHGNSQAVRLPKEFRFAGDEVMVQRTTAGVLLMPKRITFEQAMAVAAKFKGTIAREQPPMQKRSWR